MLAATSALLGIGLIVYGHVLVGVLCLIIAVLLLPILYRLLLINSNEVQLVSPALLAAIAVFSYLMLDAVSLPYDEPLKTEYIPASPTTVTSSGDTATTATTIDSSTQTTQPNGNIVYRTPSGSRYHLSADCCGKTAYETTLEQAVDAGLTPCKKCAGG